ncbi:hypothetical protein GCM10023321_58080 [Pseudonocardia eucalypti]|uniref:Antitoxin FitA-like ribbon-helix-helix domain-containing protein n=1 Tax=Pseudonocardia eucalypti TaxID=648755 RepID=A0ABP9QT28_9PSEU|nr:plasmid stability protein [Pseudonocardia eucalypti]
MESLIQIRNVPEQTRRRLKARAADAGQSLNSYLLELLSREVARATVAEVLKRANERAERAQASAVDAVRVGREERDGSAR